MWNDDIFENFLFHHEKELMARADEMVDEINTNPSYYFFGDDE